MAASFRRKIVEQLLRVSDADIDMSAVPSG